MFNTKVKDQVSRSQFIYFFVKWLLDMCQCMLNRYNSVSLHYFNYVFFSCGYFKSSIIVSVYVIKSCVYWTDQLQLVGKYVSCFLAKLNARAK